jgi:hypothetical protein
MPKLNMTTARRLAGHLSRSELKAGPAARLSYVSRVFTRAGAGRLATPMCICLHGCVGKCGWVTSEIHFVGGVLQARHTQFFI